MSDEKSGPKKPKATFGDVMLGRPSGGGRDERRSDRKPGAAGSEGRPAGERGERGGGGERRGGGDKRGQGPMVVVRRASGQVETRPIDAPATEGTPAEGAPQAAAPEATPRAPVAPAPSSALYEDVPETESFAEMFEQSAKQGGGTGRRSVRVGEKVRGTIFQLGADTAFVSLEGAGKSEAMIELRELKDDEGVLRHGVGDTIEAHVIEAGARGILLSRAITKGSANLAILAEARASGMPVEGLVLSVNKGGVEVAVGDVRAFCPISQLDVRFVENPEQFVGEKLQFRVSEVRERNVVLSRRALLEEELKARAAEVRKGLAVGSVLKGRVTNVRDFGAFVDLGGLEGMIPVSELSYVRVGHPGDVVKVGDEVEVEVLRLEAAHPDSPDKSKHKERITLSMRSRMEDPFKAALATLKEGDRLKGKVVRLQNFGAFVNLLPGVDGLVHVSALSDRRIAHPRDAVKEGEEIWVQVEKIDEKDKRIGLRRISEEDAQRPAEEVQAERAAQQQQQARAAAAPRPKVGQVVVGKVDRLEPYGVFLAFEGGKGLIPASETGTERGTDIKRHFSLGQELKAAVVDIDPAGKIRLSIPAAERAEERAYLDEWQKSQKPAGGGAKGFGTFADLLKKHGK